nr:MAG TPA: hypothetical protein [Caudoviricetes sp.]
MWNIIRKTNESHVHQTAVGEPNRSWCRINCLIFD